MAASGNNPQKSFEEKEAEATQKVTKEAGATQKEAKEAEATQKEAKEAGATQKVTKEAGVTNQTSTSSLHSQGVKKLGDVLEGTSLDLMNEALMQSDSDILKTSRGKRTSDKLVMNLPIKLPENLPPLVPLVVEKVEVETYDKNVWYPNLDKKTVQGNKTADYMKLLSLAEISYVECFNFLEQAERLVKDLGCSKSITIWEKLSPLLKYLNVINHSEAACKIAMLLHYSPEKVDSYISGIMVLKPYVQETLAVTALEKKIIELKHMIEVMILQSRAHIEETNKQSTQVSNITNILSGLQETLEQTTIKVFKVNLLLSETKPCCS